MVESDFKGGAYLFVMKSLKTKMLVYFMVASLLVLGGMAFFLNDRLKGKLLSIMTEDGEEIVNARANQVGLHLEGLLNEVAAISAWRGVISMSWKDVEEDLKRYIRDTNKDFNFLFLANAEGHFWSTDNAQGEIGEEDYFKKVMQGGREWVITNPLLFGSFKEPSFLVVHVVKDPAGKRVGVIGAGVSLKHLRKIAAEIKVKNTGFGFIVDGSGTIIAHPEREKLLKFNLLEASSYGYKGLDKIGKEMSEGKHGYGVVIKPDGGKVFVIFAPIPNSPHWSLGVEIPYGEMMAPAARTLRDLMIGIGIVLIVIAIACYLISNSISNPIRKFSSTLAVLGRGDFTVSFEAKGRDEIAFMASSLTSMVGKLREALMSILKKTDDLVDRAQSLSGVSEEMLASVEEIDSSVNRVSSLTQSISAALEETNAGIEEVASGADSAARAATDAAESASKATRIAEEAIEAVSGVIDDMERASSRSSENVEKIRKLAESVNKISEFVGVISSIADQTNLLALNAAIEAARAGEAGRGFAVVAEEVRKLAEESSKAASEIGEVIKELIEEAEVARASTEEVNAAMSETAIRAETMKGQLKEAVEEIRKVNDAIQNIASVTEEQAASTEEMSAALDSITKNVADLASNIEVISRAAEDNSKAAEHLAQEAQGVSEDAEYIRELLSAFKLKKGEEVKEIKEVSS